MRPAQLLTVLEREFQAAVHGQHTPVMLWGPPGVGKSQMVAQVAQRHGMPVIDIRLSQMEPSDLRGIPFRVDGRVDWAVPSMLPNTERHGKQGILFLDEITSVPPSVSAAAYQLILDRRLGAYEVPLGWAIFAAGNRQGDRGVTYTMPAPLANRFSHFDVDLNLDDWVAWAYANNIDERLIGFLRFRPELLFEFDPAHNPVAFPSPRSWEFADRALHKFGDVRGEKVRVPKETDLQYAVAAALVGRAIRAKDEQNAAEVFGNILEFASAFPQREMGVMLVSDMYRAIGQDIFAVPQFSKWANIVADVMLYDG
jgi:midasin (ATPase involved in ribosome maturation)